MPQRKTIRRLMTVCVIAAATIAPSTHAQVAAPRDMGRGRLDTIRVTAHYDNGVGSTPSASPGQE
jgi:hypothetical protein